MRLVPCLLSRPSHHRPRKLCTAVESRRQLHGHRRTDVTVPCPEPATPPPCGGSSTSATVIHGTGQGLREFNTKVNLSKIPQVVEVVEHFRHARNPNFSVTCLRTAVQKDDEMEEEKTSRERYHQIPVSFPEVLSTDELNAHAGHNMQPSRASERAAWEVSFDPTESQVDAFPFQTWTRTVQDETLPQPAHDHEVTRAWTTDDSRPSQQQLRNVIMNGAHKLTVASWQPCIDHNTTSARLSVLWMQHLPRRRNTQRMETYFSLLASLAIPVHVSQNTRPSPKQTHCSCCVCGFVAIRDRRTLALLRLAEPRFGFSILRHQQTWDFVPDS